MDKRIPFWKMILIYILSFIRDAIVLSFDINQKILDKCVNLLIKLQNKKLPTEEEMKKQLQELFEKLEEKERNNKQS